MNRNMQVRFLFKVVLKFWDLMNFGLRTWHTFVCLQIDEDPAWTCSSTAVTKLVVQVVLSQNDLFFHQLSQNVYYPIIDLVSMVVDIFWKDEKMSCYCLLRFVFPENIQFLCHRCKNCFTLLTFPTGKMTNKWSKVLMYVQYYCM